MPIDENHNTNSANDSGSEEIDLSADGEYQLMVAKIAAAEKDSVERKITLFLT